MKISFLKIVFALVFLLLPFLPFVVSAGTEHNVSGWGWSSNIGWISFNSITSGGAVDYGVHRAIDGRLCGNDTCSGPTGIGYAWSSSIGWIQFGGLVGPFPASGGNASVSSTGVVTGWAKALSADGNGWDGWISLSGTSPNYGSTFTGTGSTLPSQYSCAVEECVWGSDVVGWVDFSGVIVGNAIPIVTSPTATSITTTSAILGANVTFLGIPASISARGTCYGTSPAPTTNCLPQGGTTTGVYSHSRTSLTPNTTYYYRGYATNATGTGYSADGTFVATVGTGSCSILPMKHYKCDSETTLNSGTNQRSGPTKWTWTCGTTQCSENKNPDIIED